MGHLNRHETIIFMEELVRDRIRSASHGVDKCSAGQYDVYPGGSCSKYSTWRSDLAIPIFDEAGVKYFDPMRIEWKPEHFFDELRAKYGALIIMYVVDRK